MNELLSDSTISTLSKNIATELANRNRPCSMELSMLLRSKNNGFLSKYCQELYSIIRLRIETDGFLQSLVKYDKSLSCSVMRNLNDLDEVAYDICRYIVEKNRKTIDDYVEHIQDKSLCKELDLELNKDFLVSLADENIELKKHGIFYKDSILIYPHQFFRRYYNSNFVNLPSLLQKSYNDGLDVSIKVDPFRKCSKKYYSDILELDHWYGPAFSEELLMSKNRNIKRKVHFSIGIYCFCYDAKYTVFRTKMMDTGLREFMIEEYCPIKMYNGDKSPGVGKKYCIQKFAHLSFNQELKSFDHLDGAVRVFNIDEYKRYFEIIESGSDVDEKIGTRHKMFLVEGKIDKVLAKDLLIEWFRYNPHIQEYFSGTNIPPIKTYDEYHDWELERENNA